MKTVWIALFVALPLFAGAQGTKIVMLAGPQSHTYMAHEHYASFMLLAKDLENAGLGIRCVVCKGWPQDESVFDGASAIAVNCDGDIEEWHSRRHLFCGHEAKLLELRKRGVGLAVFHYATIISKGTELAGLIRDWAGGYDEPMWSAVKCWNCEVKKVPRHPVTNGVKPFSLFGEWYFHMRFREGMEGVTPLFNGIPPDSCRMGKDGKSATDGYESNPVLRSRKGMEETVAWASEAKDRTRGFGFTGLHFHWHLGQPQIRRLLLNGLAWIAKVEIPAGGIDSPQPTLEQLKENQDEPVPPHFDFEQIQRFLTKANH